MHGTYQQLTRGFAVQYVQEMAADGIIISIDIDTLAIEGVVIPVDQHGTETGQQVIGNVSRLFPCMFVSFRQQRPQHGTASAHDIHGMSCFRDQFQHLFQLRRQIAHAFEFLLIVFQGGAIR